MSTVSRETIFALATPFSRSAIAVVRVSGPQAHSSLALFLPEAQKVPSPRTARLSPLHDPQSKEIIDQALVLVFKAPASFTGEDIVEYHLHGSIAVINAMLEALGQMDGHRMAEPGEFTRRAFENGKMDLTSAEAVNDLIVAETESQRTQALDQLGGALSTLYESWRESLVKTAAYLEATIDFADEDLPQSEITVKIRPSIEELHSSITQHLNDNRRGERLRSGIKIAVIGAPNAGKSSLVNALAQRDVCMTSDIKGTTRDVIEVHLNLGGYPAIVSDTAGLRPEEIDTKQDQDRLESEGIRRALKVAQEADIRLLVFNGPDIPDLHNDTLALMREHDIALINKSDLLARKAPQEINGQPPLLISALENTGLHELIRRLTRHIERVLGARSGPVPTRARHRQALEKAQAALDCALDDKEFELIAEDLRSAARAIGSITGRIDVDNLLDVIFRDFCIGK